jgi:hypothetical protein
VTSQFNPAAPVIVDPPAIVREDTSRAEQVVEQIIKLDRSSVDSQIEFADLMVEFVDGDYHHADHCQTLEDFCKKHGFELSPREIRYRANVSRKSAKVGITREQRKKAKISKMKAICELTPETEYVDKDTGEIRTGTDIMQELVVRACSGLNLKQLKEIVAEWKGDPESEIVHETIAYTRAQKEVVDMAIEAVIKTHGDTIDSESKETKDISRGTAYHYMAVELLGDPNYEQAAHDVIEQQQGPQFNDSVDDEDGTDEDE